MFLDRNMCFSTKNETLTIKEKFKSVSFGAKISSMFLSSFKPPIVNGADLLLPGQDAWKRAKIVGVTCRDEIVACVNSLFSSTNVNFFDFVQLLVLVWSDGELKYMNVLFHLLI
jgi:hypothetical protein